MGWLLKSKATPVWLLLFCATCISCLLGSRHEAALGGVKVASIAVMLIAMVKIRFVLIHFMELKRAPWVWRGLFEAWAAILSIALIVLYLFAR